MKKPLRVMMILLTVSAVWAQPLFAQTGQPKLRPIEFYGCNWLEGKGMADLNKVIARFREYADERDSRYSAWTLTPQYHHSPDMFDVGWLGAWPDSEAFGETRQQWPTFGRELQAGFDQVVDCSGWHELALLAPINAQEVPPSETPGDGVLMFSQCTLMEGKTLDDAYDVHLKAGKAMKDMGSKALSWLFYPTFGTGPIDFDYWHVVAFYRWAELGSTMEMYVNGGGMQKHRKMTGSTATCAQPTVFDIKRVRAVLNP